MDRALYTAVSAMRSAERRTEFTSHNLANLSTHGFKRRDSSDAAFVVRGAENERTFATAAVQDFSQGPLERTGSPLHLALRGKGFFAVESPDGEVYTRRGEVVIDANGELVSEDGYPFAWEERLGSYEVGGADLHIEGNGEAHQGETRLGRLKVTDFEDYAQLQELASGYWFAGPEAKTTNADAEVRQYELEASNANGIDEMVELIAAQRAYELSARSIRMIQQSYERLNRGR